jgi:hypothetical protein
VSVETRGLPAPGSADPTPDPSRFAPRPAREGLAGPTLWSSPLLADLPRLRHGFTNRAGGTSDPPFDTLNLSFGVGDDASRVVENRERVRRAFGGSAAGFVEAGAIHGAAVGIVLAAPEGARARVDGVDALLTRVPGVALLVLGADCPVVFLHDPEAGVAGLVHAGWRGLVEGVVESAVGLARRELGLDPTRSFAAISPAIGPCCFEVGDDVAAVLRARPGGAVGVSKGGSSRARGDLPALVRAALLEAGFRSDAIDGSPPCTRCRCADFFSHRASGGRGGRGAAVLELR